jgi:twitching motility protein PilT
MKSIEELLRNLARPNVLEFGLVTNRLPSVNIGGRFEPVDDEAPSTDRVKQMLVATGGGRFVETLGEKPVQWTTRVDGVGLIAVAAMMRKDVVQARFTIARRAAVPRAPAKTEDDADNEPTVQTVSPQTPRPKPARRPEEVRPSVPDGKTDPPPGAKEEEEFAESRPQALPLKRPAATATTAGAALETFLSLAVAADATDLHLVGGRPVLLRIASELVARMQPISAEHVERLATEVVPPRLRETFDGDGSCDFAIDHEDHGRFRVNLTRHRAGTTIAIRVLGREFPSVRGLGLPEVVANAVRHSQGLVLVTGPAGHGKTTTLAALVDALNAEGPRHVYTIEDPIEHVHPKRRGMVTQREIGTHVKSWSHALDDALCSDVDVLVIGELRDDGAVRAAVAGCEAGRLVLATMSCMSAAKAIARIIERFPEEEQPRARATIASALRLVVGQRLVPNVDRTKLHVALETLPGTSTLYTLVRDGRTHEIPALQRRGRSRGFTCLDDSLAELVRAQKISVDVATQFSESPADLAAKKRG